MTVGSAKSTSSSLYEPFGGPQTAVVVLDPDHSRGLDSLGDELVEWMSAVNPDWQPTLPASNTRPIAAVRTHVNPDGRVSVDDPMATGRAVFEIRRRSGLDWDELATVFGTSRSDLCNWANGSAVSARDQTAVRRTLVAIRHVDHGSSRDTRSFIFNKDNTTETSIFELLVDRRFDEIMAMPSRTIPPRPRPVLSDEAKRLRRPEPPMLLLDADQSRPVITTVSRVADTMRAPPIEE